MPKFYLLLTFIISCTAAFSQHIIHKEIVVHPSGEMRAGNAPKLLNESDLIQVKKGDTYSIRPGFVPGSGRSNVMKGVAKAVVAGVVTYELARAAMPSNPAKGKEGSVSGKAVKSLLPAVGAGLALSFRDLTGKSAKSRPYLQYLFYNKESKLISVKTVPLDKKTPTLEGRVENSGYMKVMLQDQPGSKLRSDDMVVNIGRSVADANVAIGAESIGDEGDDGDWGGSDGSAAEALLDYVSQYGIDALAGDSFTFNNDGSVTVTDEYGNTETMSQDDFIDAVADAGMDDYDALLDDYTGTDADNPISACIGDQCYTVINGDALMDVPPQVGNTCLFQDMSWLMSMLGLGTVDTSILVAYYNDHYDPTQNIYANGLVATITDFQAFVNEFFETNPNFQFSPSGIEGAIEAGHFIMMDVDNLGNGQHEIVIDGYSTDGRDGWNPMFSYHDPATGSTGTMDYDTLVHGWVPGYQAEVTGIAKP